MNEKFVDAHTHSRKNPEVIEVVSCRLGLDTIDGIAPYTAGIHPWDTEEVDINGIDKEIPHSPDMVAVGEIGLDFADGRKNRNVQILYFTKQLDEAVKLGKPVVIHSVKAWDDTIAILREYMPRLKGAMIHGFISNTAHMRELVKLGVCISFGFRTFNSPDTLKSLTEIPVQNLFLETDESEKDIEEIYFRAAEARSTDTESLKKALFANYKRFFDA